MKSFIGIDLGTTNSVICSYNGFETRIWKSPEQNDVTPSAIYIDPRGNKYIGIRAYNAAPRNPDNSAMLFKRLMGTSTPIRFSAVNLTKTPEECSAEILRVLFGYLPEEIRNNPDAGSVITVPAAFNMMQKDATMQAAQMAGIGKVAIMQEPVAAVMSVMSKRKSNGIFLIYDFGGGTLDIALAESMGGHVNLLTHGGIAMCGGRDFDRGLIDNIVKPWLLENFNLPEDLSVNPNFKSLIRLAHWATEKAKIDLSAREETIISLSETEVGFRDLEDNEIYLDIPLHREALNKLIDEKITESINAVRETISKAGFTPNDLECIVFVGGPTNYKPLRDKVIYELGINGNIDVNPMTAVAEGASLFAESIDWSSQNRSRKRTRGQLISGGSVSSIFNYTSRTPEVRAKIVAQLVKPEADGSEFQIDSIDTAWTSGRLLLIHGATVEVNLPKTGENNFKVFIFDPTGNPIVLEQDRIIITRTVATVDAIPVSHSIGIEVLEKLEGRPVLDWLIRAGDHLPKKGKGIYKTAESLKAGAPGSINFKLWEGEIEDSISDNRPIGVFKISGSDFDDGVIAAGAELMCEYEILDSGVIKIGVSIPSIRFHSEKNFYSRQEGETDYTSEFTSALIVRKAEKALNQVDEITKVVDDPKLESARQKLEVAASLNPHETEPEKSQEADEKVREAQRLLAQVRIEHQKETRQIDLDLTVAFFNGHIRTHARPSEATAFDNLVKTAQRSIDRNDKDFEYHIDELKVKNFEILWRQDWFIIARFKSMMEPPHLFTDKNRFEELSKTGAQLLRSDKINELREIVRQLYLIQIGSESNHEMFCMATNIIRG